MYGVILGRLVIARRGKTWTDEQRKARKKSKARLVRKDCTAKGCMEIIKEGEPYFALMKRVWVKKTDKHPNSMLVWETRKFHYGRPCFYGWLDYQLKRLEKNEEKARQKRIETGGRTRTIDLSKLTPSEIASRVRLIRRRSYLLNRIFAHPEWTKEKFYHVFNELATLRPSIEQLGGYAYFNHSGHDSNHPCRLCRKYRDYKRAGGTNFLG